MKSTILLIEDNEMNRDMLSRRLIKRGFDVETATDGKSGVEMAQSLLLQFVLFHIGEHIYPLLLLPYPWVDQLKPMAESALSQGSIYIYVFS